MSRLAWSTLLAVCVALVSWSCSNGTNTPTTATAPTTTQTFGPSALTVNGAQTFTFSTAAAGTMTATITSISPDATAVIGLALGTMSQNGCATAAGPVIANDNATQGTTVTGSAAAAGNYCVRVYDLGKLTATENVTVTVVHP